MAKLSRVDLVGITGTQGISDIAVSPGKTYVLGRADGNDVVIKKNDISRQHANLEIRDDQFVVTDLGSANGTRVNGHRISGAVLVNDGDEVEFGDRKFRAALVALPDIPPSLGNLPSEATAMWAPSSVAVTAPEAREEDPADNPVDSTQTYDASTLMPPPPPDPPKASGPSPRFSTLTTGDIDVVSEEPAAPKARKRSSKGGIALVLFVMLLMGVALVGAWLVITGRISGKPATTATYSPAWEYVPPPPLLKATEKDVAELSGPDLQLYDRALYFYEIRNYLAARRDLEVLTKRYAGNKLISEQLATVKEALSNEVDRMLQHGQDNMDFLKFREAKEDFQGVLRIADQEDVRRQRAQDRLKELEKVVGQRRR